MSLSIVDIIKINKQITGKSYFWYDYWLLILEEQWSGKGEGRTEGDEGGSWRITGGVEVTERGTETAAGRAEGDPWGFEAASQRSAWSGKGKMAWIKD